MVRNAIWFTAWSVACLSACAEVTTEDPPSRLNGAAPGNGDVVNMPTQPTTTPVPVVVPGPGATTPRPSTGEGPAAGLPSSNPMMNMPRPTAPPSMPPRPTGPTGAILFEDNFDDGDDQGWIADVADGDDLVGSWAVVQADPGFVYAQNDASFEDESWAVGGDVTWTDVSFEVRFRFTEVAQIEDALVLVALRFQSKDNYYYLQYRGDGSVKIRKRVNGSEPDLSSTDLDRVAVVGEWINLRFTARGSSLEAYVDDVLLVGEETAAVVDTDLASGGIALGVRENTAVEFDDVLVTVP